MADDGHGFDGLTGAWRIVSVGVTWCDTGEHAEPYGPDPDGYMVLSLDGRIMFIFGPRDRKPPENDADRAALFTNMTAYTGRIRLKSDDQFVTFVDYAGDPGWLGEQLRFFKVSGDRLDIRTPELAHPSYGGRTFVANLVWQHDNP